MVIAFAQNYEWLNFNACKLLKFSFIALMY